MSQPQRKEESTARDMAAPPTMIVNPAPVGDVRALLRSNEAESQLRAAVGGLPSLRLQVLRGTLADNLKQIVVPPRPGAMLVDIDLGDPAQLLLFRKLVASDLAGMPVIVTSTAAGVDELRQLMRLHITDYLPQPMVAADVIAAISSALRKLREGDGRDRHLCKVFSIVRRAGGVGGSFLAIQTALALVERAGKGPKARVCLVDIDFQSAVSAVYLDVEANLDLVQIARAPERLDAQLLQAMVSHHRSGLDVLAPPLTLMDLMSITPDAVTKLLDVVCELYDYVVVDLPPAWTRWTGEVIMGSDAILLVMQLSVAAVKQARVFLEKLTVEGVDPDKVSIVVNRYQRKLWGGGVRLSATEEALGRKVDFVIADDPDLVSRAFDHGQTLRELKPGSGIEKQVKKMVGDLVTRLALAAARRDSAQSGRGEGLSIC